jgi:hypothetical protein
VIDMVITVKDIDRIAERWDHDNWDQHERAFARQWMTQAQEDIRDLVELVRELQGAIDEAKRVADEIEDVVDERETPPG